MIIRIIITYPEEGMIKYLENQFEIFNSGEFSIKRVIKMLLIAIILTIVSLFVITVVYAISGMKSQGLL